MDSDFDDDFSDGNTSDDNESIEDKEDSSDNDEDL
jgi:hypothetical protein